MTLGRGTPPSGATRGRGSDILSLRSVDRRSHECPTLFCATIRLRVGRVPDATPLDFFGSASIRFMMQSAAFRTGSRVASGAVVADNFRGHTLSAFTCVMTTAKSDITNGSGLGGTDVPRSRRHLLLEPKRMSQ